MGLKTNKFVIKEDYDPENFKPYGSEVIKKFDNNDPEMIKKFQDWMDSKGLPWVFEDGKFQNLNKKSPGYGDFGSNTKKAYSIWFDAFLCSLQIKETKDPFTKKVLQEQYARFFSSAANEWNKYTQKKLFISKNQPKKVTLTPKNEGEKIYYMSSFVHPTESTYTEPIGKLWKKNNWPIGDIKSPNFKKFAIQIATPVEWMTIFPDTLATVFDPNYTKYSYLYQKWKKDGKTAEEAEMSMVAKIQGKNHKFSDFNKIDYSVTSDIQKIPGYRPEDIVKKSEEEEKKMADYRDELMKSQIKTGAICVPCNHPDNPPDFDNTGICQGSVWCDPKTREYLLDNRSLLQVFLDDAKDNLLSNIETVMNAIREFLNGTVGTIITTILDITGIGALGTEILRVILLIWDFFKKDWYNFIGSLINVLTAGKIGKFIGSKLKNLPIVNSLDEAFTKLSQQSWFKNSIGKVLETIAENVNKIAGWLGEAASAIDNLFGTSWARNSIDFIVKFARKFTTSQTQGEIKSGTRDVIYTTTNESIRSATRKVLLEYSRQRKYVVT